MKRTTIGMSIYASNCQRAKRQASRADNTLVLGWYVVDFSFVPVIRC